RHDDHQSDRRPAVPGGRSTRAAQMTQAVALAIGVQRAESPGLWTLAWRRFCRDRVGLASFLIVVFFFGLMAASGLHLIAADWSKELGVNYAPPTRSEEHTSELQSRGHLVCRLLLEKKNV